MNLVVFNSQNSSSERSGKASISMNPKSGVMSLNKEAASLIGASDGTKMCIGQDPNNPEDWYLFEGEEGFPCRKKENQNNITFQNTKAIRALFTACGIDKPSARFLISRTPVEPDNSGGGKYFLIITASGKN